MSQAQAKMASLLASHISGLCSLLIIAQRVQECDARGDAMKYKSRVQKSSVSDQAVNNNY
jgi:hypothetical protein